MQALCEVCGSEVKDTSVHCKDCLIVFCSQECLKKENKKHCISPDSKLVMDTLKTFGLTKEGKGTPSYNGRSIIPLPGPIKGNIPRGMRSIETDEGKKIVASWKEEAKKKYNRDNLSLPGVTPYYLVDIADLARVFFVQLTAEQRNEIVAVKDRQFEAMQKAINTQKPL